MLKGIDTGEMVRFVPKQDDLGNPTTFLLGNISNRDKLRLFGVNWQTGQFDSEKMNESLVELALCGIKRIENLGGRDYGKIDEKVIDMLPLTALVEIVGKLLEFNFVGETEQKNLP